MSQLQGGQAARRAAMVRSVQSLIKVWEGKAKGTLDAASPTPLCVSSYAPLLTLCRDALCPTTSPASPSQAILTKTFENVNINTLSLLLSFVTLSVLSQERKAD